jgi:hypothetical protein
MGVVEAKIQTVEDIYHLIWLAVANKQPVRAIYKERPRLFCPPRRLGRNQAGQRRVLCYQYGGESESGLAPIGSPANWRCVVLEKTPGGGTAGRCLENCSEPFASCHLRGRRRHRCGGSTWARSAIGTVRNPPQQMAGQGKHPMNTTSPQGVDGRIVVA